MHDIGTYICGKTTPPLNCGGGCGETMVIFSFLFHDLGKCDLQCKIEFCVILFRRIELENLRVFPNLTKTTKLYRIYPFPILGAKYLYFSSRHVMQIIIMINSFVVVCTNFAVRNQKIFSAQFRI